MGAGVQYDTKPDPRLSDINIDALYAKPLKGPRSKQQAASQPQQPVPQNQHMDDDIDVQIPGPQTQVEDDMDIQIPGPTDTIMNNSMESVETEV